MPTRNSNSRKLPFPKLLVSEYSRRIAHELDATRLEFLEAKKADVVYLALPVGEEYQPSIPDDVNHIDLLSDTQNLEQNWLTAAEDMRRLQAYLADLRIKKTIGDRAVPLEVFEAHRQAIARHVRYKEILAAQLKGMLKRMNTMIDRQMNRKVTEAALNEAGIEARIINELVRIIKSRAKTIDIGDEDWKIVDLAVAYREGKINEYVQKHGASNIYDAFTQTALAASEKRIIGQSDNWQARLTPEPSGQERAFQEMVEKFRQLSAKDYDAVKHIINQLLLKKQMANSRLEAGMPNQ